MLSWSFADSLICGLGAVVVFCGGNYFCALFWDGELNIETLLSIDGLGATVRLILGDGLRKSIETQNIRRITIRVVSRRNFHSAIGLNP